MRLYGGLDTYMMRQIDPPDKPFLLPQPETWLIWRMVGLAVLVGWVATGLEGLNSGIGDV